MDPPRSGYRKQLDAKADPAIMLFGKQIKHMSAKDGEKIKEELSPRGVDEKVVSFATSSDEDEDLNPSVEVAYDDATMHVGQPASFVMGSVLASDKSRGHAGKRKSSEVECVARDEDAEKPKSNATDRVIVRVEGGDNHAGKQKGGIWSRCPRCHSADTKFCYFNNYNVNQPRHFCKHCQRYWTAGGTLRNVPIGAGKRKNKHALHKQNFILNSTRALSVPMPILPMDVPNPDPLSMVKSDPLPTVKSDPLSIVKSHCVNTNLELSPHHSFTNSPPTPSLPPCVQSQATPTNIMHPHSPNKLITLHQLHENLQSRFSQINNPHLAVGGYSKLSQIYPDLACGPSTLRPIHPELAGGCSKLSQCCPDLASGLPGLSQKRPLLQNGCSKLSQICPHFHSGCSVCPDLPSGYSEFARLGPHLGSGSSRLSLTCPHVQNGSCETGQECLECGRNELSGLAKSEGGCPDIDELKESELPIQDQKSASLERGLPDLAKNALEKASLQNKARLLQIGYPPNEVTKYMQRCNEMKASGRSASNDCNIHVSGECNGLLEIQAPPMCLQGNYAQVSSALALMEASNIDNTMKRGVGEGHNSLPIGGGLWPFVYNMFWLDPLAFPHFSPILTPQGWALPPNATKMEPTSNSPHNSRTPCTCVLENFDSSSTLTTLSTFEDVSNGACNITTTPLGKHSAFPTPTTLLRNFEDVSDGACNTTTTTSLGKCSPEHAGFEGHDGFEKFKTM